MIVLDVAGEEFDETSDTGIEEAEVLELTDDSSVEETVVDPDEQLLLTVTERGYGKRTDLSAYRVQNRAGMGIRDIQTGERNGRVVGSLLVKDDDRIMLMTNLGQVIKIPVTNIRTLSRRTKGVRLMKIDADSRSSHLPVFSIMMQKMIQTMNCLQTKRIWTQALHLRMSQNHKPSEGSEIWPVMCYMN